MSVGLDVPARSVAAAAIDAVTGEVFKARLVPSPSPSEIIRWVGSLLGPSGGCTSRADGIRLARSLSAAGIRCEVAAASKILRPAGDRVKTDAQDALHLYKQLVASLSPKTVKLPRVAQPPQPGGRPRVSADPTGDMDTRQGVG